MKQKITRTTVLRSMALLLMWIVFKSVAVAQNKAYTTDATSSYCVEYVKNGATDNWYVNGITLKGTGNNGETTPVAITLKGGTGINLQAKSEKWGAGSDVTIANVTEIGAPNTDTAYGRLENGDWKVNAVTKGKVSMAYEDGTAWNRDFSLRLEGGFVSINRVAFSHNKCITEVVLADGDNSNYIALAKIDNGAFYECSKLTSFRHSTASVGNNLFPSAIKTIGEVAFRSVPLTGKLSIPSGCETIGSCAFYDCKSLTEVDFRNENGVMLNVELGAFWASKSIKKVNLNVKSVGVQAFAEIPVEHLTLGEGLVKIGELAFNKIKSQDDMKLPSTIKILEAQAFGFAQKDNGQGWIFFNELNIPEGMEYIGNKVFSGMRSVQDKLVIPNSVQYIGPNAFINAPIRNLVIGSGVVEIGNTPFFGCTLLETVVFKPNTVLSNCKQLFNNCFSLRYVRMDDVENASLNALLSAGKVSRVPGTQTNPSVFGSLQPYTLVYLPKKFADRSAIVTDANNEYDANFIFCDGSNYTSPKFVVFDRHANYRKCFYKDSFFTTNFTDVEKSMRNNPKEGMADKYKALVDHPALSYRGCDYDIPVTFTAENAIYKRTFGDVNDYYTVSLPYRPNWNSGTMSKIKPFKLAYKLENNGHYLYSIDDNYFRGAGQQGSGKLTASEQDYCMTPYRGYMVHFYGSTDASVFDSQNVKVYAPTDPELNEQDFTNESGDYKLVGTVRNVYNEDATKDKVMYTFNGHTKTWHRVKAGDGRVFFPSLRAAVQSVTPNPAKAFMAFIMDGTSTGIDRLEEDVRKGTQDIYTLDGRYMGRSLESLPNGIYVVAGKKFCKF